MGGYDHTIAKRMRAFRERRKASGLTEVREFVPRDLVPALKAIAEEMRDPAKAEEYRTRFPASEGQKTPASERANERATDAGAVEVKTVRRDPKSP